MGLGAGGHTVDVTKESYVPDSVTVIITSGNDQVINVPLAKPNTAPIIDKGAGPLAVIMSEDSSPTPWTAPTLSATG